MVIDQLKRLLASDLDTIESYGLQDNEYHVTFNAIEGEKACVLRIYDSSVAPRRNIEMLETTHMPRRDFNKYLAAYNRAYNFMTICQTWGFATVQEKI